MDARLTDKFIGEKIEKRATGEKDEGEHFVRLIIPLLSCPQLLCTIFLLLQITRLPHRHFIRFD